MIFEPPVCDPSEAPEGFYAVPKSALVQDRGNLCRQCDWRKACQKAAPAELLKPGHRCMSYAIFATHDGKTYQRQDKCSVVFKQKTSTP